MPSGGARARSGPARDPNALRRDRPSDKDGWTTLPAEGRTGEPPEWPLATQSDREAELWTQYWAKPQAVIWERDRSEHTVALFVRQFAEAELPKASAVNRTTVRMYIADLYLTPDALSKAKLRIATDEVAEQRTAAKPAGSSVRDRLRAVSGGAS
jgi:hypothetical protein